MRVARVVRLARTDRRLAPRRDDLDALLRTERRPEPHADEATGDAELLRAPIAAQHRHEELIVCRDLARGSRRPSPGAAEQLVAQAAPDLVDLVERQRAHPHEQALAQGIQEGFGRHRDRLPPGRRATRP